MKPKARKCVVCGKLGTEKWTLSQGPDLVVADLCIDHSQPMRDAVMAVLNQQNAAAMEGKNPVLAVDMVKPGKSPRGMSFEPLDWTPPEE